jgi:hypothetical protein
MFDIDANGVAQTRRQLISEFLSAGLQDVSNDAEYSDVYNDTYIENLSMKYLSLEQNQEEMRFFMGYIDELAVQITMYLTSVKNFKNVYQIEADYSLNCTVKATNERLDTDVFEKLKQKLNKHEKHLRENFAKKEEIRKNLNLLKLVSFLVPLLIGMKRKMKIPNLDNLLPQMTGEDVKTERELPPLMLGSDFKCRTFDFNLKQPNDSSSNREKYFNLHGGIQFELDTIPIDTKFHKYSFTR